MVAALVKRHRGSMVIVASLIVLAIAGGTYALTHRNAQPSTAALVSAAGVVAPGLSDPPS